jgi:hypothetical protein
LKHRVQATMRWLPQTIGAYLLVVSAHRLHGLHESLNRETHWFTQQGLKILLL